MIIILHSKIICFIYISKVKLTEYGSYSILVILNVYTKTYPTVRIRNHLKGNFYNNPPSYRLCDLDLLLISQIKKILTLNTIMQDNTKTF